MRNASIGRRDHSPARARWRRRRAAAAARQPRRLGTAGARTTAEHARAAAAPVRAPTRTPNARRHSPSSAPCAWRDMMLENPLNKLVLLDRFETQDAAGGDVLNWDLDAWIGRDLNKLWIRSEGDRRNGDTERAELELLWGKSLRAVVGARRRRARRLRSPAPSRAGRPSVCAAWRLTASTSRRRLMSAAAAHGAARSRRSYEILVTNRLVLEPSARAQLVRSERCRARHRRRARRRRARAALALRSSPRDRAVRRHRGRTRVRPHGRPGSQRRARRPRHSADRRSETWF